MEILLGAKVPRADIYSQFVSALRTTAGCVKRRSRRAGSMCPAAKYTLLPAGHAGPALQGAAVAWGGQGRSPLRTLSLRASPRREASALGVQTGAAIRFSSARPPLDKPGRMGIIVDVRGRCIRRSAPAYYGNLVGLMTRKNRHLAEWRFLLFSRWTRIEIECPRI